MGFLPIKRNEILEGETLDFVLISADAYVDHPSFGHAIISRIIHDKGFSIGIIAQPKTPADYMEFGAPKYAFLISGGVVDSMVNNYTVSKSRRSNDEYSAGGKGGHRPDRASIVYSKQLKKLYPDTSVIIGGIEASLRRLSHYDYWSDKVMPSLLIDSGADLIIYGMGEAPLFDILKMAERNIPLNKLTDIEGTVYARKFDDLPEKVRLSLKGENSNYIALNSFEEVANDKLKFAKTFALQKQNTDSINGIALIQKTGNIFVVQNKPQRLLTQSEVDYVYSLPYERTYHPIYESVGGVPAITEVKFSITSHRGCFGSCSYCALSFHQGRSITSRSIKSVVSEAELLTQDKQFKGYINDVGGPTANFRAPSCQEQIKNGVCKNKYCIGYVPCKNLKVDESEYVRLLNAVREVKGIKKVFVRSGVRFDYLMADRNAEFFNVLLKNHISGQLKVAPEHISNNVLKLMNKPKAEVYLSFKKRFEEYDKKHSLNQFLVPYLISSHPGCTLKDAVELAEYLKSINYMPLQVQDFYPTPSTRSTCMYYTGLDPDTLQSVYVPKTHEEKSMQRALLQYRKKENYEQVKKALIQADRTDLIGFSPNCIIKPLKGEKFAQKNQVRKTKKY